MHLDSESLVASNETAAYGGVSNVEGADTAAAVGAACISLTAYRLTLLYIGDLREDALHWRTSDKDSPVLVVIIRVLIDCRNERRNTVK